MPKNKIEDLRNHLFETIERLMDDENPIDIERAKGVAHISRAIVETARVEIEFMKEVGGLGTGFVPCEPNELDDRLTARRLRSENAESIN